MLRYFLKYGKSQSRIWYSIFSFLELTVYMKEIKRYIIINYDTHGLILWKYSFNSLYKNCFTKHFSGFISIIKKLIAIFSLWHLVADRNTLESLRNFMLTIIKKSKREVNDFFFTSIPKHIQTLETFHMIRFWHTHDFEHLASRKYE